MRRFLLFLSALIAVTAPRASAHDFWIRPSEFHVAADARVTIDLRVGESFRGEPVARDPEKFESFVSVAADGTVAPIVGQDGQAPAGLLRATGSGLVWVVYRSTGKSIELPAEQFESYLAEEGLERVSKLRAERGESAKPGRERFSRCAKSLLRVARAGESGGSGFDRRAGLPLEIVPGKDPSRLAPGERLPLVVLHRDKPVEGVLVGAMCESKPEDEARLRTDASGRVEFVIDRGGPWLVHAVHMVPAEPASGAEWESLWASLTFEPQAPAR